jgi:hypothetical protein
LILPHEEFYYNDYVNRRIGKSPFQIVYGNSPRKSFELRNMGKGDKSSTEHLKNLYEEVKKHINKIKSQYKTKEDKKGGIKISR